MYGSITFVTWWIENETRIIDLIYIVARCRNPPLCQNGGYVDKTCRCACPDGMAGTECRQVNSDPGMYSG
jgi:hypothetical protein